MKPHSLIDDVKSQGASKAKYPMLSLRADTTQKPLWENLTWPAMCRAALVFEKT